MSCVDAKLLHSLVDYRLITPKAPNACRWGTLVPKRIWDCHTKTVTNTCLRCHNWPVKIEMLWESKSNLGQVGWLFYSHNKMYLLTWLPVPGTITLGTAQSVTGSGFGVGIVVGKASCGSSMVTIAFTPILLLLSNNHQLIPSWFYKLQFNLIWTLVRLPYMTEHSIPALSSRPNHSWSPANSLWVAPSTSTGISTCLQSSLITVSQWR